MEKTKCPICGSEINVDSTKCTEKIGAETQIKQKLSAKDLGCDDIYEIFQSSEYSDVIYYNAIDENGRFIFGILNRELGLYTLSNFPKDVEVLGVICQGLYAGCYVYMYDYSDLKIYRQDPYGVNPTLVATVKMSNCLTANEYEMFRSGLMTNYSELVIDYMQLL